MENKDKQKGSIMLGSVLSLVVFISFGVSLASLVLVNSLRIQKSYQGIEALSNAEAAIEKSMWELNKGVPASCQPSCTIGDSYLTLDIDDIDSDTKELNVTAYYPGLSNYKIKKKIKVVITGEPSTEGIAFNYAIQAGVGGINISGNSEIKGSLYSNGSITASGSSKVENPGDAWAVGSITDSGNHIKGAKHPGSSSKPLPTIDTNLWQGLAQAGGTVSGNYSPPNSGSYTNYGPKEITGNFSMSGSGQKINLTGPLYIHGNLSISGGEFKLDDSFGTKGTVVLVDGTISISGSSKFYGNASGAYILFVSTNTSESAISYTGSATGEKLALFAPNGSMNLSGSGKIVAMTGKTLNISGSGEIEYEAGLASTEFSGGPGGLWTKKSWQEQK